MAQQYQDNQSSYDLSVFESPDLSNFAPGRFQYTFDRNTKVGRTFLFNPNNVQFCPMESRGSNFSNIVRIQTRNPVTGCMEPLVLQTPLMPSVFGLCTMNKDGDDNAASWKVDLSFKDMLQLKYNRDHAPADVLNIENFFQSLYILDQMVLDKAKENVRTWFAGNRKLELKPDLIDGLYKPLTATRFSKTKNRYYAPALRVKAGRTHGSFNFRVYDVDRQLVAPEQIQPDCMLVAVVEVTGVWFVSDSFGVGLRLLQAQVRKSEVLDSFCIAASGPSTYGDVADQDDNTEMEARDEPCLPQYPRLTGMK